MAKKITIYTTNTCAYCPMVKEYLKSKGYSWDEVNLDQAPQKRAEMAQYTTATTVPLVIVQDDAQSNGLPKMMQGFNLSKLAEAIA